MNSLSAILTLPNRIRQPFTSSFDDFRASCHFLIGFDFHQRNRRNIKNNNNYRKAKKMLILLSFDKRTMPNEMKSE